MASKLSCDAGYKRVLTGKSPVRAKLKALGAMIRPSRRFLEALARSPLSHAKVRVLAVSRLQRLELESSPTDRCPILALLSTGDGQAALFGEFGKWLKPRPTKSESNAAIQNPNAPRDLSDEDKIRVARFAVNGNPEDALGEYLRCRLPKKDVRALEAADEADCEQILSKPRLQGIIREAIFYTRLWATPC